MGGNRMSREGPSSGLNAWIDEKVIAHPYLAPAIVVVVYALIWLPSVGLGRLDAGALADLALTVSIGYLGMCLSCLWLRRQSRRNE